MAAFLEGRSEPVVSIMWTPDGARVVAAATDGASRLWDPESGESSELRVSERAGQINPPRILWDPAGERILGYSRPRLRMWDAHGEEAAQWVQTFRDGPPSWSPEGAWLASGSSIGVVTLRDAASPEEAIKHRVANGTVDIAWRPGNTPMDRAARDRAASLLVYSDEAAQLMRVRDDGALEEIETPQLDGPFHAAAWTPDGARVAIAAGEGVYLWTPSEKSKPERDKPGKNKPVVFEGVDRQVESLIWSEDGARLFARIAGVGTEARTWAVREAAHGIEIDSATALRCEARSFLYTIVSPDGALLASSSPYERAMRVWDAETGEQVRRFGGEDAPVLDWAFSPCAAYLAVSMGTELGVWRVPRMERVLTLGEMAIAMRVAWSPEESRLVAGMVDGTCVVWNLTMNDHD